MAQMDVMLQYEGDAVDAGSMEVRHLAPSLLAAGDAIQQAHDLLRIAGPAPQVVVRATRPGSFIVDLIVADVPILPAFEVLFNSALVTAGANLTALVGAVVGPVNLVRGLAGRRITRQEEIEPGRIRLILEDGTIIETSPESLQLVLDGTYRRSLKRMVEPVSDQNGIRSLTVSTASDREVVTTTDVRAFEVPPAVDEDLGESESEVVLRPVNIAFAENNKWRFSDGL